MNRVERAVIMAAGIGTRMYPVTKDIPKPLVKINGKSMVETVISALHKNKIYEIYIVIGYLKEQFNWLAEYYGVILLENPYYQTCNNISSLYVARDHLENAIILDGDQIIYDSSVLKRDFQRSGYCCVWTDSWTKEWILNVKDNIVCGCSRTGGNRGWQLYSISRWTKEDGLKLKKNLEYEFVVKENRQIYWDDVVLTYHLQEYELEVYEMKKESVVEIDNIYELAEIDERYQKYLEDN